jgi:hypothetical protein
MQDFVSGKVARKQLRSSIGAATKIQAAFHGPAASMSNIEVSARSPLAAADAVPC